MRVALITALLLVYTIPFPAHGREIERMQYHMGTYARVYVEDGSQDDVDAAFETIKRLDLLLSDYNPESQVSRISKMAGKSPVAVSPEVMEVLATAKRVAAGTGGAFDPTIGALTIGVYRFGREDARPPTEDEITRAKSLFDYNSLVLKDDTAYLEKEGMLLDLGGIGKGYAAEKAAETLKSRGIKEGMVALSGDMKVFGYDTEIGIRSPTGGPPVASFRTGKGELAVSTSGGYERVIDPGGKSYHHLIVPESGFPGRDFRSVTVVLAGDAALADAYATSIFTMGGDEALAFLDEHPEIGVFLVFSDGKTFYNEALRRIVKDPKLP
ncbi:MAG: FAD:protein FMN transferase [Candidatus Dadabacteria bacterium]|nr:FAD:protein FMN transferase [Candidatus Dadabacteria bacterium]